MGSYLMMLYVTEQQEVALKSFFGEQGWPFLKPDLSATTEKLGGLVEKEEAPMTSVSIRPVRELARKRKAAATADPAQSPVKAPVVKQAKVVASSTNIITVPLYGNLAADGTERSPSPEQERDILVKTEATDDDDEEFAYDNDIDNGDNDDDYGVSETENLHAAQDDEMKMVEAIMAADETVTEDASQAKVKPVVRYGKRGRKLIRTREDAILEGITTCRECGLVFTSSLKLKDHRLAEHNPRGFKYQCIHCVESFPVEKDLILHRKHVHKPPKAPCQYCGKVVADMKDHQKNCKVYLFEHGVNRCEKCKKIFKDAEALEQHETKCSTTCPICNKELASMDTYKRHLATHDPNGAKFMCPDCGKRHYHKWELEDHFRSKHLPLAKCNDCGEMVPGGAHPKRCKAKVQENICPHCAMTIRGTGYHLKRHIRKAHLEDDDDKKKNGVPKYECSRCQQKFVLKWHAKRHVQACDEEPPAEVLAPGPDDTNEADREVEEKQQLREPRDDVSQEIVLEYQIQN